MDWTIFHALNGLMRGRDGAQDAAEVFNAWAIFAVVAVAGSVWFLARPGGSLRSKLAALSAAAAAGLALLVNAVLGTLWYHPRPFVGHPHATVLLIDHGRDNSFPSDHASVAFAVAFAVLVFHRRLGVLLVVAAAGVGLDRILVGVHYPLDVAASVLVGLGSALLVTQLGRQPLAWAARQLSRLSDPVVLALHARIGRLTTRR
ncbi:MAG TPA: phosphatase PAP2 family protein [Gaiellaceae bacterium]|nr:phosphatase PAP2 family protein [Gaiellaceae bacterium]